MAVMIFSKEFASYLEEVWITYSPAYGTVDTIKKVRVKYPYKITM